MILSFNDSSVCVKTTPEKRKKNSTNSPIKLLSVPRKGVSDHEVHDGHVVTAGALCCGLIIMRSTVGT